jgi:hypothetical protein
MDRGEAARIFRDVVIDRSRSDVPADVVEAMDTVLRLIGAGDFGERPPRQADRSDGDLVAQDVR